MGNVVVIIVSGPDHKDPCKPKSEVSQLTCLLFFSNFPVKNKRFFLAVLFLGFWAVFVTTCGGGRKVVTGGVGPTSKLASISVTPANPSIPVGVTQQFTASGTYSNGKSHDITMLVTWRSSQTTVATVSSGGLVTPVAKGTATIIATSGKISGRMVLTVTSEIPYSIAVTPPNLTLPVKSSHQFKATGRYTDGASYDISKRVTWVSSDPSIATINESGLATAVAPGTATMTATAGTVSGSQTLTVTSLLSSISVTPTDPSMAEGSYRLFTATGKYSDGTSEVIRSQATWSSSDTTVVTVTYGGLVTAVAPGTATITVTQGSIWGHTTVTVTPVTLSSISVTHANPTTPVGVTQQFRATGIYSAGTINDITTQVAWSSSNPAVATVNDKGLVTTIAAGTSIITATSGTASGSTILTVNSATLSSLAVTPSDPSRFVGSTQQFTATGTFSDESTYNITESVTWSSSNLSVTTINSSGLATLVTAGTATITATSGTVSGSTTLTVTFWGKLTLSFNETGGIGTRK